MFNIKGESPSKNIKTLAVIIPTIDWDLTVSFNINSELADTQIEFDVLIPGLLPISIYALPVGTIRK